LMVPPSGRILDWGSGHGVSALWLAARAPGRTVVGVDIDAHKVAVARRAAEAAGLRDRASFDVVAPDAVPEESWDAIVICDVLYLLAPESAERLVRAAAATVSPGGVLVCKELGSQPRAKALVARTQERIAVEVLRLTATVDGVHAFPDPARVADWMAEAGLSVVSVALDRGFHAPHVALIGRRPDTAEDGRLHA